MDGEWFLSVSLWRWGREIGSHQEWCLLFCGTWGFLWNPSEQDIESRTEDSQWAVFLPDSHPTVEIPRGHFYKLEYHNFILTKILLLKKNGKNKNTKLDNLRPHPAELLFYGFSKQHHSKVCGRRRGGGHSEYFAGCKETCKFSKNYY